VSVSARNGILSKLKPFSIHDERSTEDWIDRVGSSEGRCQLLRSEYRAIILWIDTGIVAIPLFKIDVPSSSKCVGFGSEFSWDGNGLRD